MAESLIFAVNLLYFMQNLIADVSNHYIRFLLIYAVGTTDPMPLSLQNKNRHRQYYGRCHLFCILELSRIPIWYSR